ncbi:hypothetical protein [Calothrix sp. CCY 0018]|uniref:hypothetical protein n=1 Tax=Calothrix sp. CCY 0018 TaxID=3103864 RepID=UPI0039C6C1C7
MPKRFNNLDAALKYLNPKGTDTESTSEAPTGSQLRFYQDWKSGKRAVEYGDRDAGSRPGDLKRVTVKPFAFASADTTEYIVDLSARAETNISAAGITAAELGIKTDISSGTNVSNFQPAKITVAVVGTTTTAGESKLTGRKYRKRAASSYTFPFGRTTGEAVYSEAKAALLASAQAANRVVTYQPERFR